MHFSGRMHVSLFGDYLQNMLRLWGTVTIVLGSAKEHVNLLALLGPSPGFQRWATELSRKSLRRDTLAKFFVGFWTISFISLFEIYNLVKFRVVPSSWAPKFWVQNVHWISKGSRAENYEFRCVGNFLCNDLTWAYFLVLHCICWARKCWQGL